MKRPHRAAEEAAATPSPPDVAVQGGPEASSDETKRHHLLKMGGMGFLTLAFVTSVAVALLLWQGRRKERVIAEEINRIRQEGLPATYDDLTRWYAHQAPPPEEDGTAEWLLALSGLTKAPPQFGAIPNIYDVSEAQRPWSAEESHAVLGLLKQQEQELFRNLDKALGEKTYHLPLPPARGPGTADHCLKAKNACRVLGVRAVWAARNGDRSAPVEDVRRQLLLIKALDQPLMVPQLVSAAVGMNARRTFYTSLSLSTFEDHSLKDLQETARQTDGFDAWSAILGERCQFVELYSYRSALGALLKIDLAAALPYYRRWLEAAEKSTLEFLRTSHKIVRDVRKHRKLLPWGVILAVTDADRIAHVEARTNLHLRFIQTSCAIERYLLDHGEPPPTLEVLVPKYLDAVTIDPFTGEPLVYGRDAEGYRIYSDEIDSPKVIKKEWRKHYEFTAPLPHLRGVRESKEAIDDEVE